MIGRDIHEFEIVSVALDFWSVCDSKAESDKEIGNIIDNGIERMLASKRLFKTGKRDSGSAVSSKR